MENMEIKTIENCEFEPDQYYFVKFLDHSLEIQTQIEDLEELTIEFIGKYIKESDTRYLFEILSYSNKQHPDTFTIVKKTLVEVKNIELFTENK